jgi:hypothetical protein
VASVERLDVNQSLAFCFLTLTFPLTVPSNPSIASDVFRDPGCDTWARRLGDLREGAKARSRPDERPVSLESRAGRNECDERLSLGASSDYSPW